MIPKVTKNQGSILALEKTFGKTTGGGQIDLTVFLGLKVS